MARGRALSAGDAELVRELALRFPDLSCSGDADSLFESSAEGVFLSLPGRRFVLRLLESLGGESADPQDLGLSPEAFASLTAARLSLAASPSLEAGRGALESSDPGAFFDGSAAFGAAAVFAGGSSGDAPASAPAGPLSGRTLFLGTPAPVPAAARAFPQERSGLWERLKAFFRGPALVPAVFVGSVSAAYGSEITGANTFIHEGSHRAAAQALVDPGALKLQVDGFENLGALIRRPSWASLRDFLAMRDVHADGAAGYVSYGDLRPTELGRRLGADASRALIAAAGSAAQAGAAMAEFAVGYAVRKRHPVIGYTLMTASALQHASNSLYLWSAAGMSAGQLAEAAASGHDWASFAAATGFHPTLTALVYTALLPAEAVVLHLIGKAARRAQEDRRALASLIAKGEVSEDDLLRLYDGYPRRERLDALEAAAAAAGGAPNPGGARELEKEYRAFQLYAAQAYRERIAAEKPVLFPLPEEKLSLRQRLAAAWNALFPGTDKTGEILQAGLLGGGIAAGAAGLAKALGSALGGKLLQGLVPGLGVLGAAYGLHKLGKALSQDGNGVVKTLDILQSALNVAGAAGMATLNPILAAAGHGASLAVLIAKLLYLRYGPGQSLPDRPV